MPYGVFILCCYTEVTRENMKESLPQLEEITPLESQETAADRAEAIYHKEIVPLLEIMKPDGVSLEQYEQETMDRLYEDVKTIQTADNQLTEGPEETIVAAKDLLNFRIRKVLEDSRDYTRKIPVDPELVKKAKIALLYEEDYSDVKKYSKSYENENWNIRDIRDYVVGYGEKHRFSESDIEALLKTKFKNNLTDSDHGNYFGSYGTCTTAPESFLIALAESKERNTYQVDGALENAPDGKYSKDAFHQLAALGYGRYVMEFVDKFQGIDAEDFTVLKNDIQDGRVEATIEYVKKSKNLSSEVKTEILKHVLNDYLTTGRFYDFFNIATKFENLEKEKNSEETKSKVLEGLLKFLPRGEHYFQTKRILEYFDFSREALASPEMQGSALKCIEARITQYGSDSSVRSDIDDIIRKFDLQKEVITKTIYNSLPSIASIRPETLVDFIDHYGIPQEILESEEVKEKIKNVLDIRAQELNFEEAARTIENFPFLRDGYSEQSTVYDIAFEKIQDKEKNGINNEEKILNNKHIQESFWASENRERLPKSILEILERFESQHGKKGQNLIAIALSAYGTENPDQFVGKMESIETVLNKYNHDAIPKDARVSMGIEYEVTGSVGEEYGNTSMLGYKKDIQLVSKSANIGRGNDGIHEIALRPNYNPYMLMAEVKLLQDAGFLDFNFDRYDKAARGYHLSLVGDGGLEVDGQMYFLNNVMTMAQLTGITAGKDVNNTKDIHSKNFDHFEDSEQKGRRCEIKGMATDSVEQFEKAILTSHHAGIAMQIANKYISETADLGTIPTTADQFEKMLVDNGWLQQPFESDQERDILYEWVSLVTDTVEAIKQHNTSFVDSELNGYVLTKDGSYIDTAEHIDIVRNRKLTEGKEVKDITATIQIVGGDMFGRQTESFVNALTHINNFFLKPPQEDSNSPVNAKAVLDTMKQENYGDIMDGSPQQSIFDTGALREGYYYTQGASEEMIIHKSQILLNRFNHHMDKLLQHKGVQRVTREVESIAA